nr:xylulose kinase-1 [Tanacetum cinerariifolium]
MTLTFAKTHNMIAYLTKSDASEGFNQIIDFLNGSSIKYALTINPNIYVSCIKQFWNSVVVKKVNDVTRLQALVDKKKVVITEASIRDALCLDDAEGVECLPNEEIFTEKQVGDLSSHSAKYTSPALTQKVFSNMRRVGKGFSGVDTPLFKGMLVVQEVGEGDVDEVPVEDVNAASVATEGDVSAANDEVPTVVHEPSIPSPTPPTLPPQPSQDIPSTSQAQPTPPLSPQVQPQLPQQQPQLSQDARISMDLIQNLIDTCTNLSRRVEHLELDKIAQALEITKLKQRVKKLEKRNKLKVLKFRRLKSVRLAQRIDTSDDTVMDDVSKQGGIIANIDADEDVVLEDAKDVAVEKFADVEDNADIQGRKAQIYQIDLEHVNKVLSMQDKEESEPAKLQEVVDVVTTAKIITEVVTAGSTTITVVADVPIPAATTAAAPTLTTAPNNYIYNNTVDFAGREEISTHKESKDLQCSLRHFVNSGLLTPFTNLEVRMHSGALFIRPVSTLKRSVKSSMVSLSLCMILWISTGSLTYFFCYIKYAKKAALRSLYPSMLFGEVVSASRTISARRRVLSAGTTSTVRTIPRVWLVRPGLSCAWQVAFVNVVTTRVVLAIALILLRVIPSVVSHGWRQLVDTEVKSGLTQSEEATIQQDPYQAAIRVTVGRTPLSVQHQLTDCQQIKGHMERAQPRRCQRLTFATHSPTSNGVNIQSGEVVAVGKGQKVKSQFTLQIEKLASIEMNLRKKQPEWEQEVSTLIDHGGRDAVGQVVLLARRRSILPKTAISPILMENVGGLNLAFGN